MSSINTGRVVLGGAIAGMVLNTNEFLLNEFVLKSQMTEWFAAHNFKEPTGNFIAIEVVMTFMLGIVIVLTYALIRPRLGPGVKAAVVAGLISWFAVYIYKGIISGVLFGFTINLIGISIVWGLAEYAIAAMLGAWVYREA